MAKKSNDEWKRQMKCMREKVKERVRGSENHVYDQMSEIIYVFISEYKLNLPFPIVK